MKRLIPLVIVSLFCVNGFTQNGFDALLLSETFAGGTARSVSMAGAFGGLGADFSAASQNPAGLGFYRKSEFTFSPEFNLNNVKSSYLGTSKEDSRFNLNTNNLGFVFSMNDKKKEKGFIGFSMALGFNKLNNFNSNSLAQGINNNSSLADEFNYYANNYDYRDWNLYEEDLFYRANLIVDDTVGYKVNPDILFEGNQQTRTISKTGKLNEWLFGMGFNISNMFYFGFSFNINPVYYKENVTYSEYDNNEIDYMYFKYFDSKKITGTGFGAKIGLIARPIEQLRIGIAFHSPTVYSLTETDETYVDSRYANNVLYPDDRNYGDPFEYKVETPGKIVGSLAATIGKVAVISTDIEYLNYASMRLRNSDKDNYDFSSANDEMSDLFRNTINWKAGAEFRFEPFYIRGGFGYYGSPYKANSIDKNADVNKDSYTLMYGGGFGFRSSNFFVDLAVVNQNRKDYYLIAQHVDNRSIEYNNNTTRVITTVGFKF